MIKLLLTKNEYNNIINNIKECLATDDARPILKAVNIKIKENHLTAVAIDGYKLAKVEYDLKENNKDCNFMFTPEKINKKTELIIIEQENEITKIIQLTQSEKHETQQPIVIGDFVNYNEILDGNDYSFGYESLKINSKILAEMLKNIKCENDNNEVEILIPKENKHKPLFIKHTNKETHFETLKLLCPIRSIK